jgi:hypothetical protein
MVEQMKTEIVPLFDSEIEKINKEIAAEEVEIELTSYDISNFKKGGNKQFEVKTYTDKLSKEESALFKGDEHFLNLIKDFKRAQLNVYAYMSGVVTGYRAKQAAEPKKESMTEKVARLKKERLEKEAEELIKKEGGVNHE